MNRQLLEQMRQMALGSSEPPDPESVQAPPHITIDSLVIAKDERGMPRALIPTDVTFDVSNILVPDQFNRDVEFMAAARKIVLDLLTHILYMEQIIEQSDLWKNAELDPEAVEILQEIKST